MMFRIAGEDFTPGGRIPLRYTCEGAGVSPPFTWSGAPQGTRGYAIVCSDPDAPLGTFYHWAVYDIPAEVLGLDEAQPVAGSPPWAHARNDFGRADYAGPCPPHGHGTHRYHFRLYAVDVLRLPLPPPRPGCRDVERAAHKRALAQAEIIATFAR
ncbi:YbhB/YbcL family Raf kinase inhibitor-like protein [Roseomonas xinghualingensis]|uniref:YbhB/YbcL family Raf kinase inhibitor-like protein n=1 Tax=Roseomonas xinghualingensis TaxID=2986475 RepID=UPI0021F133B1|nr:YbhB/YbcL family Raf kinase inhibitor-like protein [Roseomonas sp. SXEYE001]MCV4209620.1 YbhB/YbcL family Raf kinase inhibitor-like protein [Roseomonas sp. SXEYE001]